MNSFAYLALVEYRRRKDSVDRAVSAGRFGRADGEALLARWLGIARACGVPVQDLEPLLAEWTGLPHDLGDHLPPRTDCLAELARARDAAAAAAAASPNDKARHTRSMTLSTLAHYLGAPAPARAQLKEAA